MRRENRRAKNTLKGIAKSFPIKGERVVGWDNHSLTSTHTPVVCIAKCIKKKRKATKEEQIRVFEIIERIPKKWSKADQTKPKKFIKENRVIKAYK